MLNNIDVWTEAWLKQQTNKQNNLLTIHHAHFFTLFQGPKIVGIALTSTIIKALTVACVNVEVVSLKEGLAGPFILLQGTFVMEYMQAGLPIICSQGENKYRSALFYTVCVHTL